MISKKIAMSDTSFYQKIMSKYQKGKKNFLNFPYMVFGKNFERVYPRKFNVKILLQLNFHNQRIINYVINKSIQGMKEWVSGIEKIFTDFVYRVNILKNISNTKKSINFQHETISGFPAMYEFVSGQSKSNILFPNILFYKSFLEPDSAISSESAYSFSLSNQIIRHFLINYGNYLKKENKMNEIIQYTSNLNPRNITVSGGTLNIQRLNYSNFIQNSDSLTLGFISKAEQYNSSYKENIEGYSVLIDQSSHLLSYRNLFLNKILKNLIYSNNFQNINSLISLLKSKAEKYYSSNKDNIERYSDLVDQSSHLLSYRNLFLKNEMLKNSTALYPQNITLSGGTSNHQTLIYSNNILKNNSRIFGPESNTEKYSFFNNNKKLNNTMLQTFYDVFPFIRNINHDNYLQIENTKKVLLKFDSIGKYYSSQNQNPRGNNLFENNSSITFIQPITKKDLINKSSYSSSLMPLQRRNVQNNDSFYFQNHKQIDIKIEQIKKISQEAKEIVTKKILSDSSVKAEIQPEIDIKRLSDKVYKIIEYNLKIEKERRGYL